MSHQDKKSIGYSDSKKYRNNWDGIFNPPRCPQCKTPIKEDKHFVRCPCCDTRLRCYVREDIICTKCNKKFWRTVGETRTMCPDCTNAPSLNPPLFLDDDKDMGSILARPVGYCIRCGTQLEYKQEYLNLLKRYETSYPRKNDYKRSIEETVLYNNKYFMPCNQCSTQTGRNKIDGRYIGEMLIDCYNNYNHDIINQREENYG